MEKIQVRMPEREIEMINEEVEEGKYPNRSEAVRDKIRKSHILEAMLDMREAVGGLDREEELERLEEIRKEKYEEFQEGSG